MKELIEVFFKVAMAIVIFFILAPLVVVLWNHLVTDIFGLRRINWSEAWGLLALIAILAIPTR